MAIIHLLVALGLPALQGAPPDTAVLRIGTRAVVVFRTRGTEPTAEARAAAVARRVSAALAAGRDSVSSQPALDGVVVLLSGEPVFLVTRADADTTAGETVSAIADRAAAELRLAVHEWQESHSVRKLLEDSALFLGATALFVLVVWLLSVGRRRLYRFLEPRLLAAAQRLGIRGVPLIASQQVIVAEHAVAGAIVWGLGLVAAYVYATSVLSLFPWTRPWGEALGNALLDSLGQLALAALRAVPSLAVLILIFVATRFVTRIVRNVFDAAERRRIAIPGIHPDTANPTRRIIVALLWMFAVVVAYPYVPGSGSTAFKGVSVIAGVLVTLGSAGLVGQAMSGLVVMYSRSFKVGDFIQASGVQGTVIELGLLSTRLRTPKNELVTLPNSVVVAGAVTDYTAAGRYEYPLLVYSSVTIGYDTPWRRVHDLLIAAAGKTEGVLKDPAPFVLQKALDDSYVEYQLNAPIDAAHAEQLPWIYNRLHSAIQDTFWEAGVEIMSPTYHAVRDGNSVTIPAAQRPKGRAPAFRVDVNPAK